MKDYWFCYHDDHIERDNIVFLESELSFTQSLRDADPKFDSPIIAETLSYSEHIIIQIKSTHEELPILKCEILDWISAASVEFDLDPGQSRYVFTGDGFLIYVPTASFGLIPSSNLTHLFSRFIELITLNTELSKYTGKSGDIRTPIPESFGQHSDFLRTVIPESFGHFRRVDRNNI